MIHLAERREVFHERLALRPLRGLLHVGEEEGRGKHEHVVPAEVGVGLLAGNQKQVAIGEPRAAIEIDLLLVQPYRARVVRMRVRVEVGEDGDVDAEVAEDGQPGRLKVDSAHVGELLVEMEVEVAHQHFISGQRLVYVVVA